METRRLPMKTGLKALPPSISIVPTSVGHAVSLCEAVGEVARERRRVCRNLSRFADLRSSGGAILSGFILIPDTSTTVVWE